MSMDSGQIGFLAANTSGNWVVQQSGIAGWPGNVFIQAQPLNSGAALVCVPGDIKRNAGGDIYRWRTKITNYGPNSTSFEIWIGVF